MDTKPEAESTPKGATGGLEDIESGGGEPTKTQTSTHTPKNENCWQESCEGPLCPHQYFTREEWESQKIEIENLDEAATLQLLKNLLKTFHKVHGIVELDLLRAGADIITVGHMQYGCVPNHDPTVKKKILENMAELGQTYCLMKYASSTVRTVANTRQNQDACKVVEGMMIMMHQNVHQFKLKGKGKSNTQSRGLGKETNSKEYLEEESSSEGEQESNEIRIILNELSNFTKNGTQPQGELALLISGWISEGGGTLNEEKDSLLWELVGTLGRSRLETLLHLWTQRRTESLEDRNVEIILQYILEQLEQIEFTAEEQNRSDWAGHATRFTKPRSRLSESHNSELLEPFRHSFREQEVLFPPSNTIPPPSGINPRINRQSFPPEASPRVGSLYPTVFEGPPSTDPFNRLADQLARLTVGRGRGENNSLKLPPIQLSKFDGSPLRFMEWWPKFRVLVHDNPCLHNDTKLLYLTSYLTESAAKELWGAGPETIPYPEAISHVWRKFADRQLLTSVYRNQLKQIRLPKNRGDINGIRYFVSEANKWMNCLREFNQMPELYSLSTMDVYRVKVPEDLLHEIATQERRRISELNITEFIYALDKYCDLREDTSRFRGEVLTGHGSSGLPTTTLATRNQPSNPKPFNFYQCLFCGKKGFGGHKMVDCPTVAAPLDRLKIFREKKRCTSCASPEHNWKNCKSDKTCWCKKKHHVSLHDWFVRPNPQQGGKNGQDNQKSNGAESTAQQPQNKGNGTGRA